MTALIQQHQGRVVNAPGDALLAEFESVVDAVKSAVEIQRELAKQNAELPADRRMEYRIGINLGDVMVDGEAIYGDGVNIAARTGESWLMQEESASLEQPLTRLRTSCPWDMSILESKPSRTLQSQYGSIES